MSGGPHFDRPSDSRNGAEMKIMNVLWYGAAVITAFGIPAFAALPKEITQLQFQ